MQGLGSSRGVCWMRIGAQMRAGRPLRGGTGLKGTIPESIGQLTQLQRLDLDGPPRARGGLAAVGCPLNAGFRKLA